MGKRGTGETGVWEEGVMGWGEKEYWCGGLVDVGRLVCVEELVWGTGTWGRGNREDWCVGRGHAGDTGGGVLGFLQQREVWGLPEGTGLGRTGATGARRLKRSGRGSERAALPASRPRASSSVVTSLIRVTSWKRHVTRAARGAALLASPPPGSVACTWRELAPFAGSWARAAVTGCPAKFTRRRHG